MTLSVTNSLSGEVEVFEPIDDEVLLYACGLTTSDPAHLGHARMWVHTDVIRRWLEFLGYRVRHVENFTDVNEKIVARVGEDGASEDDVARSYIGRTIEDMRRLNLKRAEVYPRVTEHIDEIIELIRTLLDRGNAYESNGSVYFDVTTFDGYGKLSNQDLSEIEAQGDPDERAEKRHPADFALWKADGVGPGEIAEHRHDGAAPPEEAAKTAMTWDAPWGEGRPGWHIECSAMSMTHLAETFDIHVAGRDIVFPHNENEIAQSEAATGEPFARYWLHIGLLEAEGDKMSSSLRNFTTVRAALDEVGVNVVRTYLLSARYSARQTFSADAIAEAEERFDRLARAHEAAIAACDNVDARTKVADHRLRDAVTSARADFETAMSDDLNTREAMAALLSVAAAVNRHVEEHDEFDYRGLRIAVDAFEDLGEGVFGLSFDGRDGGDVRLASNLVDLVLSIREAERAAGNFDRADELRERLEDLGVIVEDTDAGPEFRFDR